MKSIKIYIILYSIIVSNIPFSGAFGETKKQSHPTDKNVFSIVTAPGEDASSQMRISWGVDTLIAETYVQYKREDDKKGKHVTVVRPRQKEHCDVFYGKESKKQDNTSFVEDARFVKCGAELDNLKADTRYEYEIVCSNGKTYGPYHFKTAGAKDWSCCIISDFHSYPPLGNRLKSAMNMIGTVEAFDPGMDWVLHLGDVCAWGGSYSFWERLYQEEPFRKYFWAGVNGNHDNMTKTYELSNQFFRNTSYYPENGYEGEKGVCYHFRYGKALFIMLNNEHMHTENNLSMAQQWVKEVVHKEKNGKTPPQYIIVCEHYQWFYGDNGKKSQYVRWSKLFDELGVDLALAGNNHIYLRTGMVYDGEKTNGNKGTMYLQTSSSDCERGRSMDDLTNNQEIVECRFAEGSRTISALSMKVDEKGISLTLLNRHGEILDTAYVPAKK